MKTKPSKPERNIGKAIQLPIDLAKKLDDFCQQAGEMPAAYVTRCVLRNALDKLLSGKAAIINGEFLEKKAA